MRWCLIGYPQRRGVRVRCAVDHVFQAAPGRLGQGEHNIRGYVFTCVLALHLAHLMWLRARRAGLELPVRVR